MRVGVGLPRVASSWCCPSSEAQLTKGTRTRNERCLLLGYKCMKDGNLNLLDTSHICTSCPFVGFWTRLKSVPDFRNTGFQAQGCNKPWRTKPRGHDTKAGNGAAPESGSQVPAAQGHTLRDSDLLRYPKHLRPVNLGKDGVRI